MKKSLFYMAVIFLIITLAGCSGSLSSNDRSEKIGLYPAYVISEDHQVWGYIDRSGSFAIKPEFDSAADFTKTGVAVVSKDNKYGIINRLGKFIVQPSDSVISGYKEGFAIASGKTTLRSITQREELVPGADEIPRSAELLNPPDDAGLSLCRASRDETTREREKGNWKGVLHERLHSVTARDASCSWRGLDMREHAFPDDGARPCHRGAVDGSHAWHWKVGAV